MIKKCKVIKIFYILDGMDWETTDRRGSSGGYLIVKSHTIRSSPEEPFTEKDFNFESSQIGQKVGIQRVSELKIV